MDREDIYISIPTWSPSKGWHYTDFATRYLFRDYIRTLFKEPGLYNFDETSLLFNAQARTFLAKEKQLGHGKGLFCEFQKRSKQFQEYWDTEKEKCRKGVLFHNDKGDTWYLPRFFYHWLNFLQIYNKEHKKFQFPDFRDVQYHVSLYEILAELFDKNSAWLKRRQMASSYLHIAKIYNKYIFEEGYVGKIGASDKKFIEGTNGCWRYLNHYKNFTNDKTSWIRYNDPDTVYKWQQRVKTTENRGDGKVDIYKGTHATVTGVTFDKDPVSGVGGACHRKGTKVLMASGHLKEIETINTGELILGVDGLPKKVTKLFSGVDTMYHVIPARGKSYFTTGDHLIYLHNRDDEVKQKNKQKLIRTKEWDGLTKYQKSFYVGVRNNQELTFYNTLQEPTLDPYYLGLWLGDGYRGATSIIVNKSVDGEVLDYLKDLSFDTSTTLKVDRKEEDRYNPEMYVARFPISENGEDTFFTKQFVKYNLFYNKHIPDEFLYGSTEVRKKVLAGLIDTDGYYSPEKGRFEISIKLDRLREQVAFLCRSLGAMVRERVQASQEHEVCGKMIKYTESVSLSIKFQDSSVIPTRIKRKQGKTIRLRNIHTSPIKEIVPLEQEPYFGIQVDDSLYYLEDLTITHNCDEFYYEEGGIAPTADVTYGYIRDALKEGATKTGSFSIAGSVGALDQCGPLKELILNPVPNDIYAVTTNLVDDTGKEAETGMFIPVFWGMVPFIDENGNSLVEEARAFVDKDYAERKRTMLPHLYQLLVSQGPRTISEAFATRTESVFPLRYTAAQVKRIEDKEYYVKYVDLERDENNKDHIIYKPSERRPIEYNSSASAIMKMADKRGCGEMHEAPIPEAPPGTYIGAIDPVETGSTDTSESLACILIYKMVVEVVKTVDGEKTVHIEGGKLVYKHWFRYDDIDDTNEVLSMTCELYNARVMCENNKDSFIQYMRYKKRQKYLAGSKEMIFDKDIDDQQTSNREYGVYMTGKIWDKLLDYAINSLSDKLGTIKREEGDNKIEKIIYGVERIGPFIGLIREMQSYNEKDNFDQVKCYGILIGFVKSIEARRGGHIERIERTQQELDKSKELYELLKHRQPFNNMGRSIPYGKKIVKSAFKHMR